MMGGFCLVLLLVVQHAAACTAVQVQVPLHKLHHRTIQCASIEGFAYVDMSLPRAPAVKQSSSQENRSPAMLVVSVDRANTRRFVTRKVHH